MPRTLIYQIFVDRFAGPDGAALAAPPDGGEPWRVHAGGTLDGIAARLDHIVSLGADAIYLTPIFPAPSNHKYDTASFDRVDDAFGGDAAFARLAAACRARDVGLILDGVFNHVGEQHPWFRAARADATSPHAAWFRFTRHPDEYDRWRGFGHLPELALAREDVLAALLDGDGAVLRAWLGRGATGWRLDCANDLGFRACARATAAAAAAGARDGVIGEVMAWSEPWLAERRLDGVMNYWFRETMLALASGKTVPAQALSNLSLMASRYARAGLLASWNVLGSHDTPRLATQVPDAAARSLLRILSFCSPGVPYIYYGDEIGMLGGADPDNRRVMDWHEQNWDAATLSQVRQLAALRRRHRALREGDFVAAPQPGAPSLLCFVRSTEDPAETIVVAANPSPTPLATTAFLPVYLPDALPMRDLLGGAPAAPMSAGALAITLPPWSVALYAPDDATIPGYSFF
jgi:glycosidase